MTLGTRAGRVENRLDTCLAGLADSFCPLYGFTAVIIPEVSTVPVVEFFRSMT